MARVRTVERRRAATCRLLAAAAVLAGLLAEAPAAGAQSQPFPGTDQPDAPRFQFGPRTPGAFAPSDEAPSQPTAPPAEAAAGTLAKGPAGPPAKQLFGAATAPAPLAARSFGFYSRGCLAGARPLSIDGPAWQAMRLSRNRMWGHPDLIGFVERFAIAARSLDGWPGLLVGDLSQPRGGPMLTGHASHQIGLDADIWFTPMPQRRLTEKEREDLSATSMLAEGGLAVNPQVWTPAHVRLIKRAASYPDVERVLVHPAIKKALCEGSRADPERDWLAKVRPYWGHHYHFHVRMGCPRESPACREQPAPPKDDGCGKELADWYVLLTAPPKPPGKPVPPKPPLMLADLPPECRLVLETPAVGARPPVAAAPAAPTPARTAAPQR